MIVYRCVSERELADMIGIKNHVHGPHGKNTFLYEKNVEYKHFFYYYDSAVSFMSTQNLDRYYNKYSVIMAYDIEEEILKDHFGLGEYNLECAPKNTKDSILQYFKTIYFPEFAIPTSLISKNMIVGIGNEKRITSVKDEFFYEMSDIVIQNQQKFLEYEKWLFQNGTNVDQDVVLENRQHLFPINKIEKQKKL